MLPGGNERLASNTIAMVSLNEFTLNGDRLGEEVIMYDVPLHQSDNTFDPTVLEITSTSMAGKEIWSSNKDLTA